MAEVCVVGAGLIGLGIAYELAKRGVEVSVFDREEPARAASWAGAGMLAPFSEALPDQAMLALCRDALALYPAYVEELRERVGVDARFRCEGTLHVALDDVRLARAGGARAGLSRQRRRRRTARSRGDARARADARPATARARCSSPTRRKSTTAASGARCSRPARRSACASNTSETSRSNATRAACAACGPRAASRRLRRSSTQPVLGRANCPACPAARAFRSARSPARCSRIAVPQVRAARARVARRTAISCRATTAGCWSARRSSSAASTCG